jgi:TolA-binding protein
MFRRLCVLIVAVTPVAALAASKEIQELQRDIALLQESVKQLQQTQDRQLAAILEAVRLAQDTSGKSNTSLAVMERTLQQSLQDLQGKVMQPVAGLTARMDGVSNDVRSLQQAVTDLTASMEKIQSQLTDLNNAVKLLQQPAAPPPGQGGMAGGATGTNPGGGAALAPQTPCMPLGDLYQSADRDRNAGKLDLALTEFQDFLRCYGNTDRAPNAQYYIGWIHYSQGDYPSALKDFDAVLEKYPDNNNKMADAFFYKGMTLVKMSQRTAASEEFIELIQRFPSSPVASQACTQLREMGKNCPTAASRNSAAKKKKGE